jgi:hypothetical protein
VLRGSGDAFLTVVDPSQVGSASLIYSTYLGGSGIERGLAIAVDRYNRAYVAGDTGSPDFPATPDAFQPTYGASFLGGSGLEVGNGTAVDNGGNAWIVGQTSSSDFPVSSGAFQTNKAGGEHDAFVTKVGDVATDGTFTPQIATGERE